MLFDVCLRCCHLSRRGVMWHASAAAAGPAPAAEQGGIRLLQQSYTMDSVHDDSVCHTPIGRFFPSSRLLDNQEGDSYQYCDMYPGWWNTERCVFAKLSARCFSNARSRRRRTPNYQFSMNQLHPRSITKPLLAVRSALIVKICRSFCVVKISCIFPGVNRAAP